MLVDNNISKTEEAYEKNKKVLKDAHYVLQREYRNIDRKTESQEKLEKYINNLVIHGTRENKIILTTLSLPFIIGLIGGTVSGITALGLKSVMENNQGMNLSEASQIALTMLQKSLDQNTKDCLNNYTIGIKYLSLPAIGMLISHTCKIIKEKKDSRYAISLKKMYDIDDMIMMIEDLDEKKSCKSLGFVEEFLTNVDLTENSKEFNIAILSNLAEYRTYYLKEQNNDATSEETEEKFRQFINTLESATVRHGASEKFIKNEYVERLIETYHEDKSKNELTPTSKQMKLES